jgi:hypothetical protein
MFLSFAQTGRLGIAEETGRDPDSVFEEQVASRLTALGHDVKTQIGTAGFFIDLAVADPDKPGRFVLGIECDDAQYHLSRSARDRDRLRQNVLEALGWVLHRIWSTDWFLRPEEETTKVVKAIEAAKAQWQEMDERADDSDSAVPIRFSGHEEVDAEVVVAEIGTESEATAPYEEAKLSVRRQVEPHETPLPEMMKHVVQVVTVEGPVHESEIVVRIRSAWGLARAGNRIRDAVQAAIKAAKRKGDISGGPFYLVPGQQVIVRNRGEVDSNTLRRPDILPPEEVKVAITQVVEQNYGAERDQLAQAVARLFGFAATSAQCERWWRVASQIYSNRASCAWAVGSSHKHRKRQSGRLDYDRLLAAADQYCSRHLADQSLLGESESLSGDEKRQGYAGPRQRHIPIFPCQARRMDYDGMIEFQPLYEQGAADAPFGNCPSGMPRSALNLPDCVSQCA